MDCNQWRNSWGWQGAECPPDTSHQKISGDLPGKKRQGKKGKWRRKEKKRRKIQKREGVKLVNWWKSSKMTRGPFIYLFIFIFFSFFKLLKFLLFIYLFISAFHFLKPLKFVLGLPKWEFSAGKKHLKLGKKLGKMTLCPL